MEDTVYYKVELKKGTLFLFSEYHNFSNANYVFGKPIYIKKESYGFKKDFFKTKILPCGEFLNLAYRKKGDVFENVSDYEMRDIAKSEFEEIEIKDGVFDNLVFIDKKYVTNTYLPREVLANLRKDDKELDFIAKGLEEHFELEQGELGITGSIMLGAKSFGDFDFVFYGNEKKLLEIKRKIDLLTKNDDNKVFENGLFWKARFYFLGRLICSFFNYQDYLPQLKALENVKLEKKVEFSGIVASDNFSLSKNAYFRLKDSSFDSVILLSNMFKNAINLGDKLKGKCYEVVLKRDEKIAVVLNPTENLENCLQFFKP